MGDTSERVVSDPAAYRWIAILHLFFVLLSSVAVGDAIGKLTGAPVQVDLIGGVLCIYLAYWLIVVAHELGHAICVRIVGWRAAVIAVRGLTIWPKPIRIRYGLPAFGGLGGGVLAVPPADVGRFRFTLVHLGGALGNFALAILLLAWREEIHHHLFWSRYLGACVFLSALSGFINLLPLERAGGVRFDGARILDALLGANLQWFGNTARLSEEFVRLRRPCDWHYDLVSAVTDDGELHGGWLIYCHALDCGDFKIARETLNRQISKGGMTLSLKVERAFLAAFADKDYQLAYKLLDQIKSRSMRRYPLYWRARAAADSAARDLDALNQSVLRAKQAWKRAPFATASDFDFLDELVSSASKAADRP